VPPEFGIELINRLIESAQVLQAQPGLVESDIKPWAEEARDYLVQALGEESESIRSVMYASGDGGVYTGMTDAEFLAYLQSGMRNRIKLLRGCIKQLETRIEAASRAGAASPVAPPAERDSLLVLYRLCDRFHLVARQLLARHATRPTLEISDEYDVQDLLHALLRLEFEDVRAEEYSPSYAGGNSRMDFLLRKERVVVEVKCTRDGLSDKEIGGQLLEDIARYQQHPHCGALLCFIYDRDGRIRNPRGLEADLSNAKQELPVQVMIRPKHE
jgi:REase_DpnII-MboI